MPLRFLAFVLLAAALAGCGIFGGEEDEALQPKPLVDFKPTVDVERAWSASVGGGSELLRIALAPAGDGQRVYAASRDGRVSAFDPANGDRVWQTNLELPLSAGPGAGRDRVVVASSDGWLVCLRAEDGGEAWRQFIGGESLSSPLIADDSVIAYTIDGSLRVHSLFNGSERWTLEQTLPPLTLRGASTPVIAGRTVIAGFDNGRLVASGLSDGESRWEAVLSPPTGRSDLERLADIDGAMAVVGQDLYASGYNGNTAAIAVESGQVLWSREISTYSGLGVDASNVYVVSEEGALIALNRRTGAELWRQDALLRRKPTAPVPYDGTVVVGDLEGYVHFFSPADGSPVARVRVDDRMLSAAPVVIGGRLYVQSETGRLAAFEIVHPEQAAEAGGG
ncbi:MAG TPA: outer membrane protein assembly factor BamB [Woeseiaceae bacterium]